ncbi:hypothetical protein FACS189425_11230 [Clostridia bacterium]|nr:hypothetical protein FACS189425_11230 [Clostridia bacterium]
MGILTRELYIGYLTNGESRSPHIPSLQIINDNVFNQAQSIVAQRRTNNTIPRHVPITTRGQTLLSGLLYCGTCGARLTVSTKCTDGNRILRYVCYQRCKKVDACKGQTAYIVIRVDTSVTEMLHRLFDRIRNVPLEQAVKSKQHSTDTKMEARQRKLRSEQSKTSAAITSLESEIVKVIQGTSAFTSDMLNKLIAENTAKLIEVEQELKTITTALADKRDNIIELRAEYCKLQNWADVFDDSPMEAKKMIAAYLIDKVTISRGYELDVAFSLSLEQFNLGMEFNKNAELTG